MAKNALQAQLLKAGLVDSKKAKKISKQADHAKRTGDSESIETKKRWQTRKQKTRKRSKAQSRKAADFRRENAQSQYRTND
ncbi:hypothetical protein Psyaliredsea_19900 [Psychrobacter alimentarius]